MSWSTSGPLPGAFSTKETRLRRTGCAPRPSPCSKATPSDVAAGIRRRASTARLTKTKRKNADTCATYLNNKAPYLDYPTALAAGWPIATGIIEGTRRYLVADRMDITGARWSLDGAAAVLKLRAVRANGDFDDYWAFHLDHEHRRVHQSRYADGVVPFAA